MFTNVSIIGIKHVRDRLAAGAKWINIGPSAYQQSMHADAAALPVLTLETYRHRTHF